MTKTPLLLLVLVAFGPGSSLRAHEPEPRPELGLSVHLLPQQLTELQPSRQLTPGFLINPPSDPRPVPSRPSVDSVAALIAFFRQQPADVQKNGIWLVLTYSKAYSVMEKARVRELKAACRQQKIPLFICRDNELPKGWQRFSCRPAVSGHEGTGLLVGEPFGKDF
ncbi:MAG TPA: hypothetical protein VGD78_04850 [Chthoniobacterales bacterium]